jgi:hypothetical protein
MSGATRNFQNLIAFLALACTAASCGPDKPAAEAAGPHCAFADPTCMTSLGVCAISAQYYVEHGKWPDTRADLEKEFDILAKQEQTAHPEEGKTTSVEFFAPFTRLDLKKRGDALLLSYSFKIDEKVTRQKVLIPPGTNVDEMLQAANGH